MTQETKRCLQLPFELAVYNACTHYNLPNPHISSVPCLRWLVAGLSLRRRGFNPGSVQGGFVMDKVALGQIFPRLLRFSPVSFILPVLQYKEKRKEKTNYLHRRIAQWASRLRCVHSICCGALQLKVCEQRTEQMWEPTEEVTEVTEEVSFIGRQFVIMWLDWWHDGEWDEPYIRENKRDKKCNIWVVKSE